MGAKPGAFQCARNKPNKSWNLRSGWKSPARITTKSPYFTCVLKSRIVKCNWCIAHIDSLHFAELRSGSCAPQESGGGAPSTRLWVNFIERLVELDLQTSVCSSRESCNFCSTHKTWSRTPSGSIEKHSRTEIISGDSSLTALELNKRN